ncbi:MAG: hypothetical protein GF329_13620 [Candidatus Lokiarchaeota archaeon]|nr:hypothetical protein [Candidatus Lokiarchaeota archaeon]
MIIEWIFISSLIICFVIGLLVFKYTYVSLQKIVKSIDKIPEEERGSKSLQMVIFSSTFSIGLNLIIYLIYGLITNYWSLLILKILVYISVLLLFLLNIREIVIFSEPREETAVFPHHKIYEKLGTGIHKKVNSKGITALILVCIFYLIPFIVILILNFVLKLNYNLITALIFSFFYIPSIMVGYFFALGIYKSIRSMLYIKRSFNPLVILGFVLLGVLGVDILFYFIDYYEYFPYLYIIIQVIILTTIIVAVIKGAKHRPLSMTHLFKERRRPLEYLNIGQIILEAGLLFLLMVLLLDPGLTDFSIIFTNNLFLIGNLNFDLLFLCQMIFFFSPFIILPLIIYNRHRIYDVGLKNYLVEKVSNKKKPLNYKFLNHKTIVETNSELINDEIIEPHFLVNLNHCLKHEDVHLRRESIIILRKIMELNKEKIPLVVPYFMRMLKSDKVWTVRLEIAESLSKIVGYIPNEIPVILDYLQKESQDTNRYVRWGVIRVYQSIILTDPDRADNLIPKILNAYNDDEWSVRKGALEAVISISKKYPSTKSQILPPTMELLKTAEDEDILKELYEFIEYCTGLEVNLENLNTIAEEMNAITECLDEECKNRLKNNLQLIKDLKEKEIQEIESKKKKVESFKDKKYKLSFD